MIGTSTGEVFEDSIDHLISIPNQRVKDSFEDLKPEIPVIKTTDSTYGAEVAGAKTAQYAAWLSSLFMNPATRAAGGAVATALTVPFMHVMKNGIIDDVRQQMEAGTSIDKVEFKKGSAGDGFGLFSYLEGKFGKPVHEIKPEDKPLQANIQGDGSDLEGPYYSKEILDTKEIKGGGAIAGILQKHIQQGGKIPQLDYDSMPLSTNIEDRRNEDPIGNLIRSLPEREDWGKGGLR